MEKSMTLTVRAGNTWKISRSIRSDRDGERAHAALADRLGRSSYPEGVAIQIDGQRVLQFSADTEPEVILASVERILCDTGYMWDYSPTSQVAAARRAKAVPVAANVLQGVAPPAVAAKPAQDHARERKNPVAVAVTAPQVQPVAEIRQKPATADPAFLKAVDRLEKEKNELEERWEREGKADGREWALQASYEDLDIVTDAAHEALDLPDAVEDIVREELALKEDLALYREESSARMFWLFGWLDGVMEAWMEIHDEMARRQSAREERRMNAPRQEII